MVEIKSPDPVYSREKRYKLKLRDLAQETKNDYWDQRFNSNYFLTDYKGQKEPKKATLDSAGGLDFWLF